MRQKIDNLVKEMRQTNSFIKKEKQLRMSTDRKQRTVKQEMKEI